eukprot:NODE_929_length_3035_cov_0.464918.p3 type:complete len:135 gc:universal NODE_929_length_3035_cov_0.464918:1676-2080(+)
MILVMYQNYQREILALRIEINLPYFQTRGSYDDILSAHKDHKRSGIFDSRYFRTCIRRINNSNNHLHSYELMWDQMECIRTNTDHFDELLKIHLAFKTRIFYFSQCTGKFKNFFGQTHGARSVENKVRENLHSE